VFVLGTPSASMVKLWGMANCEILAIAALKTIAILSQGHFVLTMKSSTFFFCCRNRASLRIPRFTPEISWRPFGVCGRASAARVRTRWPPPPQKSSTQLFPLQVVHGIRCLPWRENGEGGTILGAGSSGAANIALVGRWQLDLRRVFVFTSVRTAFASRPGFKLGKHPSSRRTRRRKIRITSQRLANLSWAREKISILVSSCVLPP